MIYDSMFSWVYLHKYPSATSTKFSHLSTPVCFHSLLLGIVLSCVKVVSGRMYWCHKYCLFVHEESHLKRSLWINHSIVYFVSDGFLFLNRLITGSVLPGGSLPVPQASMHQCSTLIMYLDLSPMWLGQVLLLQTLLSGKTCTVSKTLLTNVEWVYSAKDSHFKWQPFRF